MYRDSLAASLVVRDSFAAFLVKAHASIISNINYVVD